MKHLWKLLLILLLAAPVWAGTTSLTGTIFDASNNPAVDGFVRFTIQPQLPNVVYRDAGTGIIVRTSSTCNIQSNGTILDTDNVTPCKMFDNSTITPANSFYKIELAPGGVVSDTFFAFITGATADLSTLLFATPSTAVPPPSFSVVLLPTISGDLNVTGDVTVDGDVSVGGQFIQTIVPVAFSATMTFDAALGSIFTTTLTGNVTAPTIANAVIGQVITIYIAQDGTGGRTFVFPANVQLRGGGYIVSDDANAVSTIKLYFDGTNWREIGIDSDEVGRNLVAVNNAIQNLGLLTNRWNGIFGQTLDIAATSILTGNITFGASILPVATGQDIGAAGTRLDAFLEVVQHSSSDSILIVGPNRLHTTVQSAHDACPSTGCRIFVVDGDRTLSADLTLTKPVTIIAGVGIWTLGTNRILIRSDHVSIIGPSIGSAAFSTGQLVIDYNGTTSAVDISDGVTDVDFVLLENLRIQANAGVAQSSATARGLKTTSVSRSVFRDIVIENFQSGIGWEATSNATSGGSILNEVYNFKTRLVGNGFVVTPAAQPNSVNVWKFFGGNIDGTGAAGSIGFDFASTAANEGGSHMIFGVVLAVFDIPIRIDQPNIRLIGNYTEGVTTAHIQLLANGDNPSIISHFFVGAGTQVDDTSGASGVFRWDQSAPIALQNSANNGFGQIRFQNQAGITMQEAGGTERLVMSMLSNDLLHVGISSNSTILRGSEIRVAADFNPLTAGGFKQSFGYFQDNVAASQTNVALSNGMSTRGYAAPRAGSVLAIVVKSNEARTAGTLTVEVTVNGAGIGLTAVLDGTNTTFKATTQDKDTDAFVAGDDIGVIITTDGSWAPTTADINVTIEVEY